MKIAVVGSGISGNLVARLLNSEHEVHLFEAGDYPGGHARTVDVELDDRCYSVDTGFMVFNHRTYPNFTRVLEMLGIEAQDSDMSFSVRNQPANIEYQGSSLNGLYAQRRNLLRPRFHRMIVDILRFNQAATRAVREDAVSDGQTVGEFLDKLGTGRDFVESYLVPMSAAIWSARPETIREFPAKFLLGFCHNHGLLQIKDRPQWLTIPAGSRRYVEALLEPLGDRVHLRHPVRNIIRYPDHVQLSIETSDQQVEVASFDEVVLACHSDQALRMLADLSPQEEEILSAFPYQKNTAVLHTDTSLLPQRKRAWASWNYHIADDGSHDVCVTYDLSRLQKHSSSVPILLTLNCDDSIAPEHILEKTTFAHPAYSREAISAQGRHDEINGTRRTYFCGAYWGYGFHEDGVNSALAVAKYFGKTIDACKVASTPEKWNTVASSH